MSIHTNARSIIKFSFSSLLEISAGRILFRFRNYVDFTKIFFENKHRRMYSSICIILLTIRQTNPVIVLLSIQENFSIDAYSVFIYLFLDKFSIQIKKIFSLEDILQTAHFELYLMFSCLHFPLETCKIFRHFLQLYKSNWSPALVGCGPSVSGVYLLDRIDVILSDLASLPNLNFFNVCWL